MSVKRLNKFLNQDDINTGNVTNQPSGKKLTKQPSRDKTWLRVFRPSIKHIDLLSFTNNSEAK